VLLVCHHDLFLEQVLARSCFSGNPALELLLAGWLLLRLCRYLLFEKEDWPTKLYSIMLIISYITDVPFVFNIQAVLRR